MYDPPGRVRALPRLAGARAPVGVALQFAACAACLLGSFAWARGHFADVVEPRREGILLARIEDWPEIKNGVPELKRADPVPSRAGADMSLASLPVAVEAPSNASRIGLPPSLGDRPGAVEPASSFDASSTLPPVAPDRATGLAEVKEGGSGAGSAAPASSVVSVPAVSGATQEARTQLPTTRPGAKAPGEGELDLGQASVSPRPDSQAPQQAAAKSIDARRSTSHRTDGSATAKADAKKTVRSERKRVASVSSAQTPGVGVSPSAPAQEEVKRAAESERVHVLGVPLPTGRKIKECLLEFRC